VAWPAWSASSSGAVSVTSSKSSVWVRLARSTEPWSLGLRGRVNRPDPADLAGGLEVSRELRAVIDPDRPDREGHPEREGIEDAGRRPGQALGRSSTVSQRLTRPRAAAVLALRTADDPFRVETQLRTLWS
jgi:hypothetical protein